MLSGAGPFACTMMARSVRLPLFALFSTITLLLSLLLLAHFGRPYGFRLRVPSLSDILGSYPTRPEHPIDVLVHKAQKQHANLLKKQTRGIKAAAAAYRARRGRPPPPRFDEWVKFAERHKSVMIEDFWDRIYDDTDPFWAVPPETLRDSATAFEIAIIVRDGKASYRPNKEITRMSLWTDMINQFAASLPDMDIPVNVMDESRLLVPWDTINSSIAISKESFARMSQLSKSQLVKEYTSRGNTAHDTEKFDHLFKHGPLRYWSVARETCSPASPGRNASFDFNLNQPPEFPTGFPNGTFDGYVSNWTLSKDPCFHPYIREMHGSFIEPISTSVSTLLFPLFGGSKWPINNEILMPAPMYWSDMELYAGGDHFRPWEEKLDMAVWRGDASGGRHKASTWQRYQRQRFLSISNGSQIELSEQVPANDSESHTWPANFRAPNADENMYNVSALEDKMLGPWVDSFSNTAFVNYLCFPGQGGPHKCDYLEPWYKPAGFVSMDEQYYYKYLPDVDGNSFSGRWRGFLRSKSLPLKATIYSEWHDSRLVPWLHFVPFDNSFVDYWAIMDYFLGYDPRRFPETEIRDRADQRLLKPGHDDVAHFIAHQGHEWGERVLRKEDMLVYSYRVLLEYARLLEDQRESMAYLDDDDLL